MRKMLLAVPVALVILVGAGEIGASWMTAAAADLCVDTALLVCDQVSTLHDSVVGQPFLMAQSHEYWKCLEKCSDKRTSCEKDNKNKNKLGTEKNWEESAKCQIKLYDCMDKCQ